MATQTKTRTKRARDVLGRMLPSGGSAEAKRKRRIQIADAEHKVKAMRDRQASAYNLRLAGSTYPQISEALGYNDWRRAHADVEAWRNEMAILRSGDELQEALDRIAVVRNSAWAAMIKGDRQAALTVIACEERQAKLLGLDSAEKRPTVLIPVAGSDQPIAIEGDVDVVVQMGEVKTLEKVAMILLEQHVINPQTGKVIEADYEVVPPEGSDG